MATRRAVLASSLGLATSGCALLSSPEPVQLFRFGQSASPGAAAAGQARTTVLYTGTSFPRAAAGDGILTATGAQISYIGGSRWAGPALILFEEAVVRAFQGSSVRLVRRGGAVRSDASLRIEVLTFEARYPTPDVAPTIVLQARALLTPIAVGAATVDAAFAAERPAAVNRVSAIADAFDAITAEVLGQMVGWTAGAVRPAPTT